MSYYGSWKIDDLLTVTANTHDPSTGAATDADAVPDYRVYEDETATPILTGSMAKLDDANTTGFYSEQLTLSAANGFEKGKSYNVYISAAVGGVTGTISHTFQMEAEVDANTLSDVTTINAIVADTNELQTDWTNGGRLDLIIDAILADTNELQTDDVPGLIAALNDPTAAAVADAVWDEAKAGHVGAGSFGEEVQAHALSSEISALNDPTAAAIADAVWDEPKAGHTTNTTFGDLATDLDAVLADTNELQTNQGNWLTATTVDLNADQSGVTIGTINAMAGTITTLDALDTAQDTQHGTTQSAIAALNDISVANILTTQMTESYAADGAAPTVAQALMMIQQMLGEFAIAGTTLTVKKVDGSTTAATFTLDDDAAPTSLTRAT